MFGVRFALDSSAFAVIAEYQAILSYNLDDWEQVESASKRPSLAERKQKREDEAHQLPEERDAAQPAKRAR